MAGPTQRQKSQSSGKYHPLNQEDRYPIWLLPYGAFFVSFQSLGPTLKSIGFQNKIHEDGKYRKIEWSAA